MILPALTAASLLIVTAAPDLDPAAAAMHLSTRERSAAVQPAITRATECVERAVLNDPRSADASKVGDLIVDSMAPCRDLMRSMIDTYDAFFGAGTGTAFFSGPYLDVLPTAVGKWVAQRKH
jgi:hypothetical protein